MSTHHQDLLSRYNSLGENFVALATSAPVGNLSIKSDADVWPASYVIHHMCDADMQFSVRYLNTLTDPNSVIKPFDEESYVTHLHYAQRDPLTSLAAFEGIHRNFANLFSLLSDEEWDKRTEHPERGVRKLTDILETVCGHLEGHTSQMRSILASI